MKRVIVLMALFAILFFVPFQGHAAVITGDILFGNSWGQSFRTEHQSNVINFWSSEPTFEKADRLPDGFKVYISDDQRFMQVFREDNKGPGNDFEFTAWWNDDKPTTFKLECQELTYDFEHREVIDHHEDCFFHEGDEHGGWTEGGDCNRPPKPPCGVPEPGTLVLLGSGLLGLVGYRRGHFKK
jgi:hypothetical protein